MFCLQNLEYKLEHKAYDELDDLNDHRAKSDAEKQHLVFGKRKINDDCGNETNHEDSIEYLASTENAVSLLRWSAPLALLLARSNSLGYDFVDFVLLHNYLTASEISLMSSSLRSTVFTRNLPLMRRNSPFFVIHSASVIHSSAVTRSGFSEPPA